MPPGQPSAPTRPVVAAILQLLTWLPAVLAAVAAAALLGGAGGPLLQRSLDAAGLWPQDAARCGPPPTGLWGRCAARAGDIAAAGISAVEDTSSDEYPTGGHLAVSDGFGASPDRLNDLLFLGALLRNASHCCGSDVLGTEEHLFKPQGATLLGLLSASHYSLHTWPERGEYTLDVYFCTPDAREQVNKFVMVFADAVGAKSACTRLLARPVRPPMIG
eukprot:TRINITY_DN3135_c0_g3_i2.p1 TRINITY_DN3135_c0_g3~~TRINITY_DN3135_c0_g3_i2.p1  ORF type:complete len:218 (+),score=39.01 TRINITY_DN3135_c0_g3_i2:67-720(+)